MCNGYGRVMSMGEWWVWVSDEYGRVVTMVSGGYG